jgi:hypothetical protein
LPVNSERSGELFQAEFISAGSESKWYQKKKQAIGLLLFLERVMGVEPTYQPWEGRILPMNYTRGVESV